MAEPVSGDFQKYATCIRANRVPRDTVSKRACHDISVEREELLGRLQRLIRQGECTLAPVVGTVDAYPALLSVDRLEEATECAITGKQVPYAIRFLFASEGGSKESVTVRSDLRPFLYALHIVTHLDLIIHAVEDTDYVARLWEGAREVLGAFMHNTRGYISRTG